MFYFHRIDEHMTRVWAAGNIQDGVKPFCLMGNEFDGTMNNIIEIFCAKRYLARAGKINKGFNDGCERGRR